MIFWEVKLIRFHISCITFFLLPQKKKNATMPMILLGNKRMLMKLIRFYISYITFFSYKSGNKIEQEPPSKENATSKKLKVKVFKVLKQ